MADASVIIDRSYTYQLNSAQKRTLPVGWRGAVDAKVAEDIRKRKFGRIEKTAKAAPAKDAKAAPAKDAKPAGKDPAPQTVGKPADQG
ncbi:hypothetical protein DDZ14_08495 [Maritimibacter sp. 55A14]|uniref:hypothetical protein n=1 Tax=Maritimibacter sp. 55A14 TaxID=2174844 RepID=UPI000D61354D|nr:hypothetical protein [Maritimibacter sp. 55A14]PWE32775.1 hypothetical protein DDZ14_08495 [Maritimibacter sp. 55A14]